MMWMANVCCLFFSIAYYRCVFSCFLLTILGGWLVGGSSGTRYRKEAGIRSLSEVLWGKSRWSQEVNVGVKYSDIKGNEQTTTSMGKLAVSLPCFLIMTWWVE